MEITGKSASYQYVPAGEIHESPSLAIWRFGLDLSSADAFAYSFGSSITSSAVSACLGMLASKSGLGGFISTIVASMAGSYTANPIDETAGKQTKI